MISRTILLFALAWALNPVSGLGSSWPPIAKKQARLDSIFTTVAVVGGNFVAFAPSSGTVFPVFSDSPAATVLLNRSGRYRARGAQVFPDDLFATKTGRLVWVSHDGLVSIHDAKGVAIVEFSTGAGRPVSATLLRNGHLRLHLMDAKPSSVLRQYTLSGEVIHENSAWIEPVKEVPDVSRTLLIDESFEVATHFPRARAFKPGVVTVIDLTGCRNLQLWPEVKATLQSRGMPKPLGDGFRGSEPHNPLILGGASNGTFYFVLINGGLVLRLSRMDLSCTAWELPRESDNYVITAIAATDNELATLERHPREDQVLVRTWSLTK